MKIILVNPPYTRLRGASEITEAATPLGLSYIAATAKSRGHDVTIVDLNAGRFGRGARLNDMRELLDTYETYAKNVARDDHPVWIEWRRVLRETRPDVVGVTALSPIRGSARRTAEICKREAPGVRVAFGGFHPTACPEDILRSEHVDAVVRGEGEITFAELVGRMERGDSFEGVEGVSYRDNGEVKHNPDRPLIENLDSLPSPVAFIAGNTVGRAPAQYGRGCAFECKFCADSVVWKRRARYMSAEKLVDDMASVVRMSGIREFTFVDGTFNLSRERVAAFCEAVQRRNLRILWDALVRADTLDDELIRMCRGAGCAQMSVGVESGSVETLKDIGKRISLDGIEEKLRKIQKAGILAVTFFCIGLPSETEDDLRLTRDLMARIPQDHVILFIYTPIPGTKYFDQLMEEGVIDATHNFDAFGFRASANHFSKRISRDAFEKWRKEIVLLATRVNSKGRVPLKLLGNNVGFFLRYPSQLWRRAKWYLGV